jgi:hypothetical protein
MKPLKAIAALPIACFASLAAQPAHAFFSGCGTLSAGGTIADLPTSCQIGDKLYSDFSTDILGSAFISIAEVGATGKQHNLTVSGPGIGGSFFNYKITVVGSPNYLLTWQTDTQSAIAPNDYTFTSGFSNSPVSAFTLTYGSNAGTGVQNFDTNNPTETVVSHSITNSGTLNGFTDTVTQGPPDPVPAPLPLLGAAAIAGSLKRLRHSAKRMQVLTGNRI